MSNKYYQECVEELETANDTGDLLRIRHSFDFTKITFEERDSLDRRYYEIRDRLRGYGNKLDSDFDRANFCHGGDLFDDD